MLTDTQQLDCKWYKSNGTVLRFGSAPSPIAATYAKTRCADLIGICGQAQPGDGIEIGVGLFNLGLSNLKLPPCEIWGHGEATHLQSQCANLTAFEVEGNTALSNMWLDNNVGTGVESVLLGFGLNVSHATLRTNNIKGTGVMFALYSWTGDFNNIYDKNSYWLGGKWIVMNGVSSGSGGGIYLNGSHIEGIGTLTMGNGQLVGLCSDGGPVIAKNCTCNLVGQSGMTGVAGAWTNSTEDGNSGACIQLNNFNCTVQAGGAARAFDLATDPYGGSIIVDGGTGSGTNGNFTLGPNANVKWLTNK